MDLSIVDKILKLFYSNGSNPPTPGSMMWQRHRGLIDLGVWGSGKNWKMMR